ncbi:MAG: tetratricopeptide repeat protein [Nannocystaceae bacterium]
MHVVDGVLRRTPNAPSAAYEAYVRGVLATEAKPPRNAEAQIYFQRAVALDPDEALLWTALAEVSFAIGDELVGEEALRRALALDPTHAGARALRSREEMDATAAAGRDGLTSDARP